MKQLFHWLVNLVVPAVMLVGLSAFPAVAQDKKGDMATPQAVTKVLAENDKVRVYEVTYAPGAENQSPQSSIMRVVRGLTAGTLERRYADGKTERVDWKLDMVQVLPPSAAYTTKNVGKTLLRLYVVAIK
jgi:hypothetical protein